VNVEEETAVALDDEGFPLRFHGHIVLR